MGKIYSLVREPDQISLPNRRTKSDYTFWVNDNISLQNLFAFQNKSVLYGWNPLGGKFGGKFRKKIFLCKYVPKQGTFKK